MYELAYAADGSPVDVLHAYDAERSGSGPPKSGGGRAEVGPRSGDGRPSANATPQGETRGASEVARIGGANADPGTPTNGVYEATAVDRAVSPFRDNPQPAYPSQLRAAGIEGSVVARFVVDTTGRVEPGSIDIVAMTQVAFSEAVRHALIRSRFVPAQYGHATVRQLVEQRFSFALTR